MPRLASGDTAERILDVAERLIQTRGFNGFSYADIAAELKVRNASVHHHYPTKATLGVKLVARYRRDFGDSLERIEAATADPGQRLRRYAALYTGVLRDRNRMCLCGMLASDFETLPKPVRRGVRDFFADNEKWLARVLEDGRRSGRLAFSGSAAVQARLVLSSLEGAMLVARSFEDVSRLHAVAERLIAHLEAPD